MADERMSMFGVAILTAAAIAAAVIVALCGTGVVARNPLVGLRLPSLFASDEAWRCGHRAATAPTLAAAVVCSGLSASAMAAPTFAAPAAVVALVVLLLGLAVAVVLAGRAARTAGVCPKRNT
jgi:hypothetical protein